MININLIHVSRNQDISCIKNSDKIVILKHRIM